MKTFLTEKHNIPDGATHYLDETSSDYFAWFKDVDSTPSAMVDGTDYWVCLKGKRCLDLVKPIPQTKEVVWVNGEECIYKYKGEVCLFIGEIPIKSSSLRAECIIQHKAGAPLPVTFDELSKPETQEDREKREREENGQSLYELVQNLWCSIDSKYTAHPYDSPMVDSKTKEMYAMLAVAVEYRKEKITNER